MKKPKPQKTEFESKHGTVIVYTRRHLRRNGCKLRNPHSNLCGCPKWLYLKPKGGRATQRSAGTPSYTEACAEAQCVLDSFNPLLAKALEITEPKPGITIEACLDLYEASLQQPSRALDAQYVKNCLAPFRRRKAGEYQKKRTKNLTLLDFIDRENVAARVPITRVEQVTSDVLDQWAAGWKTNDLSSQLWRSYVTMFMSWCMTWNHIAKQPEFRERLRIRPGNRCGAFSDEQIARLRAAAPFYRTTNGHMPENFAARILAFVDLGRWAGMAVADIVNFSPRLNLGGNNVLSYARVKNGQHAAVLLDPQVAARLRSIPPENGSDSDRPFRLSGTPVANRAVWRERFKALCAFAGVTNVETENGAHIPAHPHALRDSFAVDAIVRGVDLANVSRMLGHSTTAMTEKKYLPWLKRREDHSIEDQRRALARAQAPEPASAPTEGRQIGELALLAGRQRVDELRNC